MGDVVNLLEPVPDGLVRSHGVVIERKPKVEDDLIDKIRKFSGVNVTPSDVYAFRMVAASDGVDSYWTQHDVESSLKPMAEDLRRGQSLLGNHDYETFAYGSSVDGRVEIADIRSPIYEETFGRSKPGMRDELRTRNWLVGDYYVARGLKLNGEETDSIIRGMELGAIRKASISFMVEQFTCGIDGKDMLAARLMGAPGRAKGPTIETEVDDKTECRHLPGVDYGEDGRAWARMLGSQLIETSLVYKNASPSSLLLRKAEDLARAGMLSATEAAQAESLLGIRLPHFERQSWGGVSVSGTTASVNGSGKEVAVKRQTQETPPAEEEVVETAAPAEADAAEPEEEQIEEIVVEQEIVVVEEAPTGDQVVEAFVAASTAVRSALAADLLGSEEMEGVAVAALALDRDLSPRWSGAVSVVAGRQAEGVRQTRDREVEEALGRPITVEAIRTLKADADLGRSLFEQMVNDAIAARNGLGAEYDVDAYRTLLLSSRSVEFVKAEKASYDALKADRFRAGRQVVPPAPREEKARKHAPAPKVGDGDNLLAPRAQK